MGPQMTEAWTDTASPPPPSGTDPLAIASLVSGLLALPFTCCCGCVVFPAAIAAIVTGVMVAIKPDAQGKVMAYVGIGAGALSMLIWLAMTLLGVGANILTAMQNH